MTSKSLILAAALAAGCVGAAWAETPAATDEETPKFCTNDKARVDEKHVYSAECPAASGVRRPDGTWVPADDTSDKSSAPGTEDTGTPEAPPTAPTAPDMGSGTNY
jgi:hypothetical protein